MEYRETSNLIQRCWIHKALLTLPWEQPSRKINLALRRMGLCGGKRDLERLCMVTGTWETVAITIASNEGALSIRIRRVEIEIKKQIYMELSIRMAR